MQTKPYLFLHCFALAMALAVGGCGKKDAQVPRPAPVEVGVIILRPQAVEFPRELPGRTLAYKVAEIRPQVSGIVSNRLFEEGSEVKSGQLLYQIDPGVYQTSYEQALANLAKERASLHAATLKAKRYADLVTINAVSKQENDDAQAILQQSIAAVEAAKAALGTARINLVYSRVTSPVSGRIGKSLITEGALVTANQPAALATVQQFDPIYVDVSQSSTELLNLKKALAKGKYKKSANQLNVRLILENGSEYLQVGKLQFTDVTVDSTTGSVLLRTIFPNPKRELLPGMFVRARLIEGSDPAAILVPQKAVIHTPKGEATVMVVGPDHKAMLRTVKAVRTVGNQWLIGDGVKAGDQVIVDNLMKVRPGVPVKPVPSKPASAPAQ